MTEPELGTIGIGRVYGKCPVCGHKQWFYDTKLFQIQYCRGLTNQQRYKHEKVDTFDIMVKDIIWKEHCNKSKEMV